MWENLYPKSTLQHGAKERQLELVKKVKTVTFCRPLFRRAVNIKMHHHTHRHMRMHWCARAEFVIQLRQGNPRWFLQNCSLYFQTIKPLIALFLEKEPVKIPLLNSTTFLGKTWKTRGQTSSAIELYVNYGQCLSSIPMMHCERQKGLLKKTWNVPLWAP